MDVIRYSHPGAGENGKFHSGGTTIFKTILTVAQRSMRASPDHTGPGVGHEVPFGPCVK